jgi:hypothetical protein
MTDNDFLREIHRNLLTLLIVRRQIDPDLHTAVDLGRVFGLPIGLGVVVDGVIFRGAPGPDEKFAEYFDQSVEQSATAFWRFEDSGGLLDDVRRMVRERSASGGTAATADQQTVDGIRERTGDGTVDWNEASDDEFAAFVRKTVPPVAFSLNDAQMFVAGVWSNVGSVRIRTASVSAWWPLAGESGVSLTYGPPAAADAQER